jgi:hypothetical protein
MFWTIRFLICWLLWLRFADKSRCRELLPVCIFASLLGSLTDTLVHHIPLWAYDDTLWAELSDDLSIYPVVVYLFLQWLPGVRTRKNMLLYWFYWTTLAIGIEIYHLQAGYMNYPTQQWNLGYSYLADWFLYWLFYRFHQLYRKSDLPLDRISHKENWTYPTIK